jgi:hypothetical protein
MQRLLDWLFLGHELAQARQEERAASPDQSAMRETARAYAEVADGLLDSSDRVPIAPVLSLYREAIFLLVANDLAGKRALSVAYETDPGSVLDEAARGDAGLARLRHLLAMHGTLEKDTSPVREQRDVAQVTRASVRAMLELANVSRVLQLVRRRRWRLAVAVSSVAAALAFLTGLTLFILAPTDLAQGRPWRASSALPAVYTANILFHTNEEMNPWFEIDLGESKEVRRLLVKNRSDSNWGRAVPLIAELSEDQANWKAVARRESPFSVWEPDFAPQKARYVRLRVPRVTSLHLEQVKVF